MTYIYIYIHICCANLNIFGVLIFLCYFMQQQKKTPIFFSSGIPKFPKYLCPSCKILLASPLIPSISPLSQIQFLQFNIWKPKKISINFVFRVFSNSNNIIIETGLKVRPHEFVQKFIYTNSKIVSWFEPYISIIITKTKY